MPTIATRPAAYFGVKLSANVVQTPEGYLVFKNAVIARTGFQEYRVKEIPAEELADAGVVGAHDDDKLNLYRSPEEVFSKRTIASFEGKPITDGHIEMLDVYSHDDHAEGHVQNVRPGTEPLENGDMPLLADLFVTSANLVSKYKAGIRELSCGYNYHVIKVGNQLEQVDICGNHVAFVESGRAGRDVRVNDSKPTEEISMETQNENALGEGLKTVAQNSTGSQFMAFLRTWGIFGKGAVATDAEPEKKPEGKDASGKDEEKKRLHAALDKMLDGRDNMKEEQAAQDEADAESLKALFVTPSQEESRQAGVDAEMETNNVARSEQETVAEEERTAAADEESEEEEEDTPEGEDEAVETNPSPEIPADKRSGRMVPTATDAAYKAGVDIMATALKPFIARSKNKQLIGAFDSAVKRAKGQGWQGSASYGRVARAAVVATDSARSQFDEEEARNKKMEDSYKQARDTARNVGKR